MLPEEAARDLTQKRTAMAGRLFGLVSQDQNRGPDNRTVVGRKVVKIAVEFD